MKRKFIYTYLLFSFFACSPAYAIDLPAAGIRFLPFVDYQQISFPSIPTYTYKNIQTGQKMETYGPFDLWVRNQHITTFQGKDGTIELATLKHLIPQKLPLINNLHVLESDYYETIDGMKIEWNDENIRTWVEMFAGEVDSIEKNIRGLYLRYHYLRFTFKKFPREEKQAFVLGNPKGEKFFFLFHFAKGLDISEVDEDIWGLLETVLITGKRNIVTNKGKYFQNYHTNMNVKKGGNFKATRKRVISEIKNLIDWWYVETKNYVIKSNLTIDDRSLVFLIQEDIEIMRKAFKVFFPPIKKIDEVSVVTVFKSRREYQQYIPADFSWSGGIWMPYRKELVISPNYIGDQIVSDEEMLTTIYHEAFHQYFFYALDEISPPIWYNEGHAMLFEACEIDYSRKTVVIQENEQRMKVLELLIKKNQVKLEDVMLLSPNEFQQKDNLLHNYAVSWALVYFFREAGHIYKDQNYEKVCDVILQELIKTRDWKKATRAGLAIINIKELNEDFLDFWTGTS